VQAAWDAVGDTYAICLTTDAAKPRAVARIVRASDPRVVVAEADLLASDTQAVSRVHAAANRDAGGYLFVWDQFDATYGSRLICQRASADGAMDAADRRVAWWDTDGDVGHPTVAYQGASQFVLAWAGLTDDRAAFAVHALVVDSLGAPVPGLARVTPATSRSWASTARPRLTVNPGDGSMLLTYWYSDGVIWRPGARGLAAGTIAPLAAAQLDAGLKFAGGIPGGAAWDPERGEYVATSAGYDNRIAVRRLAPDGTLRPGTLPELHEGTSAVPYAGGSPGSLGLLRVGDTVDDGLYDRKTTTVRALAAPLR
jgi:hypothetical protein